MDVCGLMRTVVLAALFSGCSSGDGSGDKVIVDLPADLSTGTFMVGFEHDGMIREALVVVPESYDPEADTPLVLNFHGFDGTARGHLEDADLREQAAAAGGILVMPQGSELDGSASFQRQVERIVEAGLY